MLYKCTYLYNKIKSDGGLSHLFLFPSFLPFCVFPFLNLNPYVAVERSICWPDGVKGELNQAAVSLGLVLHMIHVVLSVVVV